MWWKVISHPLTRAIAMAALAAAIRYLLEDESNV
jgi:hypothetical protein